MDSAIKTTTAKYDGHCKGCGRAIRKGDQITVQSVPNPGGMSQSRTRHLVCPVAVPVVAKVSAAPAVGPCRKCGTYCYGDCRS